MNKYKIIKNDDGISFIIYDKDMTDIEIKSALKKFNKDYVIKVIGDEEFFITYGKTLYIKRFCNINLKNIQQINLNYYGTWNADECFFTLLNTQGDIFVSKDYKVKKNDL